MDQSEGGCVITSSSFAFVCVSVCVRMRARACVCVCVCSIHLRGYVRLNVNEDFFQCTCLNIFFQEDFERKGEAFEGVFGKMEPLSTEEYQHVFAETGIDLDDRLTHFNKKGLAMEANIAQYVNYAKVIPGFKNLNPKDVSKLLKGTEICIPLSAKTQYVDVLG